MKMLEYSFQIAMLIEFLRRELISENEYNRLKKKLMKKYSVNVITP
jgi:hypothetical protein